MKFFPSPLPESPSLEVLRQCWRCDETSQVKRLLAFAQQEPAALLRIEHRARVLVEAVRQRRRDGYGIDALMHEYQLSTPEGIVLMCLAEALLRIPDEDTADRLIRDKLSKEDWHKHLGHSDSLFVNASTFGLMVAGRMIRVDETLGQRGHHILGALLQRSSEPVIRAMLKHAMRILGSQFVMGRDIEAALQRARDNEQKGFLHSYDMLGEAARTRADADRYLQAYLAAINSIGKAADGKGPLRAPGISIKLSALHPRYEFAQGERVMKELYPRLLALAEAARDADIGLTIDAEEAERLEPSLMLLHTLMRSKALRGWQGLGLAVQAYQKRAFDLIEWLAEQCRAQQRRLMLRLVKGAYWDSEIKRAQERGLESYPVFTRKAATDVSYIACAKSLLARPALFYPQFATHNAHTVATVLDLAEAVGVGKDGMELQRLHGMGVPLHEKVLADTGIPCRIYAPVGSYEDLLPYLVRRLLENGANTSFVNRIADDQTPVERIIADPRTAIAAMPHIPHPRIPLPRKLYAGRDNSRGLELNDPIDLRHLQTAIGEIEAAVWEAPLVPGCRMSGRAQSIVSPADRRRVVGQVTWSAAEDVELAITQAAAAFTSWNAVPVQDRASCLERAADSLEERSAAFIALCQAEAGKTLADAVAEVREAIDFCRYYAQRAREDFEKVILPGPTGERNTLSLEGRGVFVCISPWNFPLAIFLGQVAAALVCGNTVVAKPAEQTPLIAAEATRVLIEAGVPKDVLQLLPGSGEDIGAKLVRDARIAGVAFTGGIDTAWAINRALAAREAPIACFIAETGGLNAMLVDSSALAEQVVSDVVSSAFQSAGQRCSALRLLLVQEEIAPAIITMLGGAMAELAIGDPEDLATDVGPVIDVEALTRLQQHAERMDAEATLIYRCVLPAGLEHGTFFAPVAYELRSLEQLPGEVFGPVLHVLRYRASERDVLLDALNARGHGLTFGIHSRIDATIEQVTARIRAGNVYVNRNIIGAVVGVHPFGGMGLSGTGPKAGGPDYLRRFAVEKTVSVNTTASGGNASLMTLDEPQCPHEGPVARSTQS